MTDKNIPVERLADGAALDKRWLGTCGRPLGFHPSRGLAPLSWRAHNTIPDERLAGELIFNIR
jgi:hypothetical protein